MATLTLTVGASSDDAVIDEFTGGYDDTSTFQFYGQPGSSPPSNFGAGLRFTNVTLTGADTINSVTLKLMKDTTEFINVPWRLAAINQDNTATFSSGSPPGSRAIVATIASESVNVNHTDGTVYSFPTTATPQADLVTAVSAVFDRGGWASGNALGIVSSSDQDSGVTNGFGRETHHNYDSSVSASEPQLVIDYTAGSSGLPPGLGPSRYMQVSDMGSGALLGF